jgi:hypothetical protein
MESPRGEPRKGGVLRVGAWEDDAARTNCAGCNTAFSITNRCATQAYNDIHLRDFMFAV